MKHSIILVGADKGGVGKTTVSRALLDYFERNNVLARAFDTENPRGTLHRFYQGRRPSLIWQMWPTRCGYWIIWRPFRNRSLLLI